MEARVAVNDVNDSEPSLRIAASFFTLVSQYRKIIHDHSHHSLNTGKHF
jgi:hypothetical protein